jgi:TolB-like protein/Tfp pilus assembly protein PilF
LTNKLSFFAELRRRNVYRAAVFYAASAWLLVQVATQVFPFFDVPNWAVRWIVIAAVIGFPFALLFSWFYEWTPQGIVRESEVATDASITHQTGKKLDRWIIAILGLAVVLLLADKLVLHKDVAAAIPDKSIAVLPFENLAEDKANAYFATGMQDEILTRLAGIHDLKVISRTSTEQYASHPPNLKIVAEQLSVATVLEGSVQKAGDAVHINVQLIDARSDSHLWAQSYDRELKDIFGVQRDVAEKVADALKAQLLPAESVRIASVPTQNPEAYDLYLRANSSLNRANDEPALVAKELPQAIALYQQALAKDPGFALAAAMQSQAHMLIYWFAPDHSEARLAAAKSAADQALALQPNLGEGRLALGIYWYWGHRDYAQALQQLELARKTMPNSADIDLYFAVIARRQGHEREAIEGLQRAIALNPRSSVPHDTIAFTYNHLRRYTEADQAFVRAAALSHDPADELVTRAANNTVPWKGDIEALRVALGALVVGSNDYVGNAGNFFLLAWWSRDYAAALKVAEGDAAVNWADQGSNIALPRRLYLAWAYEAAGDSDNAKSLYVDLRTQMQGALQQRPDDADLHLTLGFAAAGLGINDEAVREGRKATSLVPASHDSFSGPAYLAWLAQIHVRVGENDQAVEVLRELLTLPTSGGAISPALLKLDPIWDPLRKDPRFLQLIADGDAAHKGVGNP